MLHCVVISRFYYKLLHIAELLVHIIVQYADINIFLEKSLDFSLVLV